MAEASRASPMGTSPWLLDQASRLNLDRQSNTFLFLGSGVGNAATWPIGLVPVATGTPQGSRENVPRGSPVHGSRVSSATRTRAEAPR